MRGHTLGTVRPTRSRRWPRPAPSRRSGFTLLEVLIAASALLVAMLGFSQAMLSASKAQLMTRQQTQALEACRRELELMKAETLRDRFREYNTDPSDDVDGPGLAPGANFAVPGLSAVAGDPDGMAGEILMPVLAGAPGVLREDLSLPDLGTPLDLDSDGAIDATDHKFDYAVLPVLVRVRWQSPAGPAQVQLQCILGEQL